MILGAFGYAVICVFVAILMLTIIANVSTDDVEWWHLLCVVLCLVVGLVSFCRFVLTVDVIDTEDTCERFGYAEAMRYKQEDFCVGYAEQEPYFVSVDSIEGWKE